MTRLDSWDRLKHVDGLTNLHGNWSDPKLILNEPRRLG